MQDAQREIQRPGAYCSSSRAGNSALAWTQLGGQLRMTEFRSCSLGCSVQRSAQLSMNILPYEHRGLRACCIAERTIRNSEAGLAEKQGEVSECLLLGQGPARQRNADAAFDLCFDGLLTQLLVPYAECPFVATCVFTFECHCPCTHVRTYTHTVHACTRMYTLDVCMCVHVCTCVYMCVHVCVCLQCVYMYTHTHTHTHMYIHTHTISTCSCLPTNTDPSSTSPNTLS